MDFNKFGKVVLALGILIVLVGVIQISSNQPKKFNRSKSKTTVFGGRNDLGNMLDVNITNMSRNEKRKKATNVLIVGCIVSFIGLGMSASSSKKNTVVTFKESDEIVFCPNCGSKLDGNANFCPECGKEIG